MSDNLKLPNSGEWVANCVLLGERRIVKARVQWQAGCIRHIAVLGPAEPELPYLLPGLIDAHLHIESSLLPPAEFARIAVRHGTVACVCDPHEIANVLGLDGIRFMLDDAARTPFRFLWGAPACVPATDFETSGARLDAEQLVTLFASGEAGLLAEVMNYPAVIAGEPGVMAKLALAKRYHRVIDGHAPGLLGVEARQYAAAGIGTDHECTTLAEAQIKLAAGMRILIREGSAARNFEALQTLISDYPHQLMFCSDDKHPDQLQAGHIDRLLARACALGHDVFAVLQMACLNPAEFYGFPPALLRPGDRMDAVLVNDLLDFRPLRTWVAGQCLAQDGRSCLPFIPPLTPNRFAAQPIQPDAIRIAAQAGNLVRVITVTDGELRTGHALLPARVVDGYLAADCERDVLWLLVLNRYQAAAPALALVQGFGLRSGALVSSVAHDSHNLIAVGADLVALCQAVNGVIEQQGGIACVVNGEFDCLPLPVAGLMSDRDGDTVATDYQRLQAKALLLGSPLQAPFMTLSFMALLVIPALKLSDRGLFDSQRFQFTPLIVD